MFSYEINFYVIPKKVLGVSHLRGTTKVPRRDGPNIRTKIVSDVNRDGVTYFPCVCVYTRQWEAGSGDNTLSPKIECLREIIDY